MRRTTVLKVSNRQLTAKFIVENTKRGMTAVKNVKQYKLLNKCLT